MRRSGQILQAQSIILNELERQYGGNAQAAAEGYAGAIDTLGENFKGFAENNKAEALHSIAGALATTVSRVFDVLAQIDPQVITITASFAALTVGVKALQAAFAALIGTKLAAFFAPIIAQIKLGNVAFASFIAKTKAATIAIKGFKLALASTWAWVC